MDIRFNDFPLRQMFNASKCDHGIGINIKADVSLIKMKRPRS